MIILVRPTGGILLPADTKALECVRGLEEHMPIPVKLLRSRSARQNALYWQCLERVVDSTGRWRTPQELHAALRIALGHVDEVLTLAGRRVLVPSSTAFAAMSQDEAQAYYDAAFRLLAETVGCSIDELTEGSSVPRSGISGRAPVPPPG